MGCECWNSVEVYGPDAEIERFRRQCIDLPPGNDPGKGMGGWDGCDAYIGFTGEMPGGQVRARRPGIVYTSNYREDAPKPGCWRFAFDTETYFPVQESEELAPLFPALAFHCECIDSLDDFMGFGWFNGPPGGEEFRQDMPVPGNYWTGRGVKRDAGAQARHDTRVATLLQAARTASGKAGRRPLLHASFNVKTRSFFDQTT